MLTTCRALAGSAALLVSLWGSAALAAQVVVMDETWVHGPDMPDSHFRVAPIEGSPTNWVSPVDYSQGKAYVYLEVHTKPTDQPTRFQVCFEASPTYACTAQSPVYTEVGVYEWESDFAGFWSPPGESVDWTLGVKKIASILKDTMNGKPSADNVGAETAALYMPTEVRMVVTLVEPGGVYVPPTPTGEETTGGDESESDGSSSGSGSGSSGGVDTTGASTTGGPGTTGEGTTTGAAGTSTTDGEVVTGEVGGPSSSSSSGSSSTSEGSGASDSSGGAEESSSGGGCGCRSSSGGAPGGLALAGLLLGFVRRRRP